MRGVSEKEFAPEESATREMLVTVLYRLGGEPEIADAAVFSDVPAGNWYTKAIAWAKEDKIVEGYPDGSFGLGKAITREEMAAIFNRFAALQGKYAETAHDLSAFVDAGGISPWALDEMETAVAVGLLSGQRTGSELALNPQGLTRRCELATVLMNYHEKVGAEMTMEEYLADTDYQWFATGKTDYQIQGKTVSKDTEVYNALEDVHYTAHPNSEDIILKGTVDEEWVTRLSKVMETYTKPNGTALTAEDFTPDTYITLKTIPTTGNFACFVPANVKVSVNTAWGDVLHVNRDGVPHGEGDYLVCAVGEDGKPDLSDVWVVNGEIFKSTYDMTNAGAEA